MRLGRSKYTTTDPERICKHVLYRRLESENCREGEALVLCFERDWCRVETALNGSGDIGDLSATLAQACSER